MSADRTAVLRLTHGVRVLSAAFPVGPLPAVVVQQMVPLNRRRRLRPQRVHLCHSKHAQLTAGKAVVLAIISVAETGEIFD